jgi:hypothetical protein
MSVPLILVEAKANVLGLAYGERGTFPENHPEVLELLSRGVLVDVNRGERVTTPVQPKRPCGCGH